ncbi:T7SS effector LXG polymorphic toxin [Psychrobacillus sp. FJAT-21963]|uniref:T7SS effector LXG polymorphic toxin n=1 Tax=Psychrobacillus sp. FJAT-21963 TaxID=1712028 RepID=UPI0006F27093|nr:T7SS effector LXG polymorphic toxin [Psychrobacillus sp. FJAT-21963]
MKILDVDLFQDGLQRNITMLDRLSSETEAIHRSVEGLVQMEDQLKGAGGNSIRSFYEECHIPFLHFFQLFSEHFKQVLHQMEEALHSLEPDSSGYILEQFLEGELEQGLTFIGQLTASLTDETNSIMDQVSDIVGLPHLDDSGVQEGVIQSKRKRDDTVMQLHEFDASQTTALNPIEQDLQTMNTWLRDIEGLFQAGISDITFEQSQWNVLTFRSEIRTELFPKVYLNPSNLWIEEQEKLIGTMITAATFQALEGKKVNTIEENVEENIKYHEYDNGLLIKEYVVGQTIFYEVVSKVEYKEEAVKADKPKENKLLDSFQFVLDIAGLIPVVGEVADGVNGVIYSARGDALNATLSFSAMIPIAGWASTGGKLAKKGSDLYQSRNVLSTEKVESIYSPIYQDVVNSPLGKTQNQLDIFTSTRYKFEKPNLTFNMPSTKVDINSMTKGGNIEVNKDIKNVEIEDKGTVKDRQIDYTKGFDVDPKYSSYEQRVKTTPVNKGEWSSERAESLFISDKTGEIKKYLDEAGVDGVDYKNGMPDFSPFSKGEVKLDNMTNDRKSNFSTADEELAKKWSTPDQKWTAEDIADWREDNKYTWHELNDLETIQLVPSKINSVFKHLGGVGEYNIKVKLGE